VARVTQVLRDRRKREPGNVVTDRTQRVGRKGSNIDNEGPLTRKVLEFEQTMKRLVTDVETSDDWGPLAEFIAVDKFQRVGTFLEVQDWQHYTQMLTGWASATSRFETTVRRISELPGLVYFEIEERHFAGDDVNMVNSLSVFEFDGAGKICRLDVYLQQPTVARPL
jgi:hypothetical protein